MYKVKTSRHFIKRLYPSLVKEKDLVYMGTARTELFKSNNGLLKTLS